MNESLYLGRIGGTRIGVNWSLAPIFALIAWSLAVGQLPNQVGGYGSGAYWMAGVVTAVAFFASLLAHELSHALVARRHGMVVKGIVLWLFGGVAQIEGDMSDARSELRVALVGPATSLAVAGVSGAAAWGAHQMGISPLLVASLAWLGGVNALLAVFNLLPAFPLDGGRVLRALLWRHWADRGRATSAAAGAGRVVGYGLIGAGVFELLATGSFGGLWLAMIGWFVTTAATQQAAMARSEVRLGDVRVSEVMSPRPVVIPAELTVAEAFDRYVRLSHLSSFPVVEPSGRIVGLTTLARMHAVPGERWWLTPVREASAPPAEMVVCRPDDRVADVAGRILASPDRRALVIDGGRLVGIVSPSDLERGAAHGNLAAAGR